MSRFEFNDTTIALPAKTWTMDAPDSTDHAEDSTFVSNVCLLFSEMGVRTSIRRNFKQADSGDFDDYFFATTVTLILEKPSGMNNYETVEIHHGDTVSFIGFNSLIVTRAVTGEQEIY